MRSGLYFAAMFLLGANSLRAESGDVEGSHDFPGFARLPGFVITDFDEDNPAEFLFPVASPLPTDSSHLESIPVNGHRYRIRYELAAGGTAPGLLEIQRFYEKQATAAGYKMEKSGAAGDVTETFRLNRNNGSTWVYLEPAGTVNMLTIIEARDMRPALTGATKSKPVTPPVPPAKASGGVVVGEDPIEAALIKSGRVSLELSFLPDKPDLRADAEPVVNHVARVLGAHPEWHLVIEGHTDSTGDPQDNQFLSAQRARTVQGMLIAAGIKPSRLIALGLGGSYPVADDRTAEGREKNRRIDLIVRKE